MDYGNRIRYYHSYSDDFVESSDQDFRLPEGFRWTHRNPAYRAVSWAVLLFAHLIGIVYVRVILRARIVNRKVLDEDRSRGLVLYCNHTQVIGDPIVPAIALGTRRMRTIVSPANLGIPVLGRLLPMLGAMPIPKGMRPMRRFVDALSEELAHGSGVVVFPEAHLWPYCTKVRPLPEEAFSLPVVNEVPVYCMTTTYQRRRFGRRPRRTYYVDGPFFSDGSLGRHQRRRELRDRVYETMRERSRLSTYAYVDYVPAPDADVPPASRPDPTTATPRQPPVPPADPHLNVMYCGDRGVERGVLLSVMSMVRHTEAPIRLYLLTARIEGGERTYEPMRREFADELGRRLRRRNALNTVELVDLTGEFAEQAPRANMGSRFTPCCMIRLFADRVEGLPDKVLYLDYDVVCNDDPSMLFSLDVEGYEIAGTLDYYGRFFFRQDPLRMDYVNSGVLLMNMAEMRRTGLLGRCRALCRDKWMFMPDQSSLNRLARRKRLLPRRFNEQRELHDNTVLQHFSTSFRFFPLFRIVQVKPWQVERVHSELGLHAYDDLLEQYQRLLPAFGMRA